MPHFQLPVPSSRLDWYHPSPMGYIHLEHAKGRHLRLIPLVHYHRPKEKGNNDISRRLISDQLLLIMMKRWRKDGQDGKEYSYAYSS